MGAAGYLARLSQLLDQHGDAIEYDLATLCHGWDLLDFFRGSRPWPQLERILARLPRYSHFYAGLMDNDDAVGTLVGDDDGEGRSEFGLRDWTYDRELLSVLINEVRALKAVTVAGITRDKAEQPSMMPFPTTAVDRVRERRRRERHVARVQLMMSDGGEPADG